MFLSRSDCLCFHAWAWGCTLMYTVSVNLEGEMFGRQEEGCLGGWRRVVWKAGQPLAFECMEGEKRCFFLGWFW